MRKLVCLTVLGCCLGFSGPCFAQGWPPWADDVFRDRGWRRDRDWREPDTLPRYNDRAPPATRDDVRNGGPRPNIAAVAPPVVDFNYDFPANSIVIDTGARKLYYVRADKRAYEYRISVGREGFNWTGTEKISRKQEWPDWYPPAEMRERDASLPEKMTGGVKNPLGAVALYLGNTLYRIHGTNDVKSIGHAQSSGCFRMLNTAAAHLASIAEVGTTVNVVTSVKEGARISRAPQPPPPVETQSPPAASLPPPAAKSPPRGNEPPPAIAQPPQQQVQSAPGGSRRETAGADVKQSPPPAAENQPPPAAKQPPPAATSPPRGEPSPATAQPPQPQAQSAPERSRQETAGADVKQNPSPAATPPPPQVRSPPQGSQQAAGAGRQQNPSGDVPDYAALRRYTFDKQ